MKALARPTEYQQTVLFSLFGADIMVEDFVAFWYSWQPELCTKCVRDTFTVVAVQQTSPQSFFNFYSVLTSGKST